MNPAQWAPYELTPFLVAGAICAVLVLIATIALIREEEVDVPRASASRFAVVAGVALIGGIVGSQVFAWPFAAIHRGDMTADVSRTQFEEYYDATVMRVQYDGPFSHRQVLPDLPREPGESRDMTLWFDGDSHECTVNVLSSGYAVQCDSSGAVLEPASERHVDAGEDDEEAPES